MSARQEAIVAMQVAIPFDTHGAVYVDDAERVAAQLLDAIPASVLARLAVERGGLEQVGWLRSPEHMSTLHRLVRTPEDARRRGEVPVYRLTEKAD